MKKVLFICYANSCRSQIAEAFARLHGQGVVEASSAGIKPAGFIHPKAIVVMREAGEEMLDQRSKSLTPDLLQNTDVVVTMSSKARLVLPSLPRQIQVIHWGIEDPARVLGKEAWILQCFRMTRDEIEKHVKELIQGIRRNGSKL